MDQIVNHCLNVLELGNIKIVHNNLLKEKEEFSPRIIQAHLVFGQLHFQSGRETAVLLIFSTSTSTSPSKALSSV